MAGNGKFSCRPCMPASGRRLPVGARAAKQPFADLPNIFHRLLSANIGNRGSRPEADIERARRERSFISMQTTGPAFVPQPSRERTAFVRCGTAVAPFGSDHDPGRV